MKLKITLTFLSILIVFNTYGQNNEPFVIPKLQEWTGSSGFFRLKSTINLVVNNDSFSNYLNVFVNDLKAAYPNRKVQIRSGKPKNGDICFHIDSTITSIANEGYELKVDDYLTVNAKTALGAFWSTRTILQILEQEPTHLKIPKGIAKAEAESFRKFTDNTIKFVESFGKKVRLWGALTHAQGQTPVKSANVTMNLWYNGYAEPAEMFKLGYKGISTPDGWLYIVPKAGYYYDYLNLKNVYQKWAPNVIGNKTFSENNEQIRGGAFAVWNDHVGNGITQEDVTDRVFPALQVLSQKMWIGNSVDSLMKFDVFNVLRKQIGEGPSSKIKDKSEIGYDYTVSFNVNPTSGNLPDAVLVSSPNAVVKLKQLNTGKLGFSREGYHYNFDYAVPENEWTKITITGNKKGTSLFVNGVFKERLEGAMYTFKNPKDKMAKVQTLFFPLKYIGNLLNSFKGAIRNLKVFNKVLSNEVISTL